MSHAPLVLPAEVARTPMTTRDRSKRGFASMDPKKHQEIAAMGGVAAHRAGKAHEFTSEEAKIAGRKGGAVVSADRAHMAAIGRKGGQVRGRNQRSRKSLAVE